ncbi:MAG: aminotransferase class I/II-fold pyridoxal phosphate-dependent enzyme [Chloroflexota bacterium]
MRPVLPSFDDMAPDMQAMLKSGMVTKGEYLAAFEAAIADHLGVRHAVAVSSCTTGLMLVYRALGLTGDVIVPSFTFMATVSALVWAGSKPVFADVDLETQNLDPAAVEAAITPTTTGIVATHIFGNPAAMDALQDVADRHGLTLVFDAAHGFGTLHQGRPVGSQGKAQVFSLSPTKLLIAGEGGIVATNDDALAATVRMGREYGNAGNYDSAFAGLNARMPEASAIMGLRSLKMLPAAAEHRTVAASWYRSRLADLPGIEFQLVHPGDRCSYKDLSITVDPDRFGATRDALADALRAENIDTRKYYDPPVHLHTAYRQYWSGEALPHTERLAQRSLSLPLWSNIQEETVHRVCSAVQRVWEASKAARP